ncbi:MAG TPA: efflux transporter outer membrane subunit [Albitalea sp.]|uniref:efflux transporter outer membrane subunit n=1 Tax=Piscinibacter sp. TaxID=1903157 RepID=UPI002ED01A54
MNHNALCPRVRLRAAAHPVPPRDTHATPRLAGSWLTVATMLTAVLATAALVAGCASTAGVAPPSRAMLTATQAGATDAAAEGPRADWWRSFGDPQLDALVDKALASQPSLQVVQARLVQAQAAADAAGAARRPQVNGAVDLTDQRFTENGLVPPPLAGSVRWNNSANISATWELDLFGRQRAALASAIGQLRATEADAQAARVLLAGNVATAYVNLGRLVEARTIAEQALGQRGQTVSLVRQRIQAGLDTNVELRQSEGLIAQTRVELEAADEATARARHALAELTGQGPHALDTLSPSLAALRSVPLPATLGADLLGRRADLVAQRWRVEAAAKDVDVARAQFYPNVNLAAFVGLSSIGLDNFVKAGSQTYGIGPALRLPIFDGGRLRANLGAKNAEVDAAVEGYNAALLRALREVADEIASLRSVERQQQAQDDALKSAESANDLAAQRYRAGLGNYLTVLTAEQNVLAQRRAASDLKARHLGAEAALARALGGGYQGEAPPALAQAATH